MSSNLNYKQVANVERRTWNVDEYEKKAQARAAGADAAKAGDKRPLPSSKEEEKEEFRPAEKGAAGPERSKRAFLKARRDKVDIDSKVGSTEIVSAEAAATTRTKLDDDATGSIKDGVTKTGVGWHCKVCDCFLKDSHTYLDHINGRKHQRNLGYSMRVEKNTTSQIKEKLSQLAKEKNSSKQEEEEPTNYEDVVKAKDEEAAKRKEERARKREERKKRMQQEQEEDDDVEEEMNPDMAAMMGFAGFGGGNKNR